MHAMPNTVISLIITLSENRLVMADVLQRGANACIEAFIVTIDLHSTTP